MSWIDIFYPSSSRMRDKVAEMFVKLYTHMENNFKTTNDLIAIINEHLPGKQFQPISVDHDKTIKENCERFITRINEIMAFMKEKKKAIKANIDPVIYRKLLHTKGDLPSKLKEITKHTTGAIVGVGSVVGIGAMALIYSGKLLASVSAVFGTVKTMVAAGIVITGAFMAVDMIVSAILGEIERGKLEEAMREVQSALRTFEPASREYGKEIMRLQIQIEIHQDKKPSWKSQFFPGNPGRRDEVVDLFTKLLENMKNNFKTTNDLTVILHEHLPGKKFQNIEVDRKLSIKENCDRFITRMNKIQAHLSEKEKLMKTKIDPVIYSQIIDTKVAFAKKLGIARTIPDDVLTTIGTATGLVVCAAIQRGKLLVSLVDQITKLKVIGTASVMIGVGSLAMDRIATTIIEAVQQDKLEEAIRELETALTSFIPASGEYGKQITNMSVTIDVLAQLGMA